MHTRTHTHILCMYSYTHTQAHSRAHARKLNHTCTVPLQAEKKHYYSPHSSLAAKAHQHTHTCPPPPHTHRDLQTPKLLQRGRYSTMLPSALHTKCSHPHTRKHTHTHSSNIH